jgi:hypothetical protein
MFSDKILYFFSKLMQLIKLQNKVKCFGDVLCLHLQAMIKCWGSASNWHEWSPQKILSLAVTVKAFSLIPQ